LKPELQPVRIGLLLALVSILLGFLLGAAFGYNEDRMKDGLKESAAAVRETVYKGDDEAVKKTLDKSWAYLKRSHLHLGAIGTAALVQSLLLAFLGVPAWFKKTASILLGVGSIGYGLFWLFAGMRAPGLGGTGAAKESLAWLGQPTAALIIAGTVMVLFALVAGFRGGRRA
jgi:hypothetical protein